VQPIVPYFTPFRRPLNYHKHIKNFGLDAHVRVFKVVIKTNNETVDEKIINLFNFTLKDNTFVRMLFCEHVSMSGERVNVNK
jgi:hypothetical protein